MRGSKILQYHILTIFLCRLLIHWLPLPPSHPSPNLVEIFASPFISTFCSTSNGRILPFFVYRGKTKNPDFASKSGFYSLLLFFKVVPPGIEPGTQGFSALPSRMTTNKILRQWVEKAGIDKKITYHTSRHTFGTMMMTVGADLYTTCKLMGHADVRTTQIYAKIVDSKKIEAVDMVDRMFEREEATD